MTSFSAYLSIYNDWDLLGPALASMKGRIQELVVVDGAYEWMVPYLQAVGKDPLRSDPALYEIIETSGIPARFINRCWANEPEKRIAGYAACQTDYVFRVDADEILFFNEKAFDAYLSSGQAIGEMEMPLYDSPGYVHAQDQVSGFGKQPLIFDARQLRPEEHLQYLWLVLTADTLPKGVKGGATFYPEPVAFNAHLSTWRTATGASQRAAFYSMNWVRANGFPWVEELSGKPIADFREIFEYISPRHFSSALARGAVANGHFSILGNVIRKSPLSTEQEASFAHLYENHLASSFELNEQARAGEQIFLAGSPIFFNISREDGRLSLLKDKEFRLITADQSSVARSKLHYINAEAPFESTLDLETKLEGNEIEILLPDMAPMPSEIRCGLSVSIWPLSGKGFGSFIVI
ncbi:hypothetical protein J2X36_001247 [Methylobacterium sp. BE186]|uniref:hypothetical protein n=1 Tax=Methylobacterium sp. BE186 TaxID=2817715 RepID=UPI00285BA1CD|nr:hypothetical protein [Methylobacterium sp. BE186]MDR7036506.1 hypothetical protein [Methylobacterium sp. BE186]